MEIVKLKPAIKDYLWGGDTLPKRFGKGVGMPIVAESWELSAHPDGESVVSGGRFDGCAFSTYLAQIGQKALGERAKRFPFFPILIKFIDARLPLSVQVHPNDAYALAHENEYGKTEMWYVVDCKPGAFLYCGVNRELTRAEFAERIKSNTVEEALNRVAVKPGDAIFIESGILHAIGAGILICEIQQNSNSTYRVYDYGRKDDKGNPRPLHIEKALEVSTLTPINNANILVEALELGEGRTHLADCPYFTTDKVVVQEYGCIEVDESSFASLIILQGETVVCAHDQEISAKAGDSVFIPAGTGEVELTGSCVIIQTGIGSEQENEHKG